MEGIKNNILEAGRKLGELKEIKKRAEYNVIREDGHYVVEFPEFEHSRYSYYLFPKMTRDEAVEDALKEFHEDIDYSIEWREAAYRRYLNSNYLVVDATGRSGEEHDPLEKVECPECGSEVYKYVNGEVPCPRCGNELMGVNCICYD
jgi:ssDNA-binding Zn-finger/Zn-ribbon topoisomerase 1